MKVGIIEEMILWQLKFSWLYYIGRVSLVIECYFIDEEKKFEKRGLLLNSTPPKQVHKHPFTNQNFYLSIKYLHLF